MTALFTVHHLGVSQSERVVWVCEELGLPYELDIYARDPESRMAPADYKVLHPMGTAPVLTDGDKVFSESGAIVEYIVAKYGKGQLAPSPDADNFADYLFWFHFSNGTLTSTEMLAMVATFLGAPADHPAMAMVNDRTERASKQRDSRAIRIRRISPAITSAASGLATACIASLIRRRRGPSRSSERTSSGTRLRSRSRTMIAPPLRTKNSAFLAWWSAVANG